MSTSHRLKFFKLTVDIKLKRNRSSNFMFGNNKELKEANYLLGEAYHFWAWTIIKMDPFARNLIISRYSTVIGNFEQDIAEYKRWNDEGMGLPIKLPKELEVKNNLCKLFKNVLEEIKKGTELEEYEGQNYLEGLYIPSELEPLYKKRCEQINEDFPRPLTSLEEDDEDEDEDYSFQLTWDIYEFGKLLNKGFELGSKYFFLDKQCINDNK